LKELQFKIKRKTMFLTRRNQMILTRTTLTRKCIATTQSIIRDSTLRFVYHEVSATTNPATVKRNMIS